MRSSIRNHHVDILRGSDGRFYPVRRHTERLAKDASHLPGVAVEKRPHVYACVHVPVGRFWKLWHRGALSFPTLQGALKAAKGYGFTIYPNPSRPTRLHRIRDIIHEADWSVLGDTEAHEAAMTLLAALEVGADVKKIHELTGLPESNLRSFESNLRQNGVWQGEKTCTNWDSDVGFWVDVGIARGWFARTEAKPHEEKESTHE